MFSNFYQHLVTSTVSLLVFTAFCVGIIDLYLYEDPTKTHLMAKPIEPQPKITPEPKDDGRWPDCCSNLPNNGN